MAIPLSSFLPLSELTDYKVHLACWNGENQPLNVFLRDRKEWDKWNAWRSGKDEFNRPFILSLIDFYPEKEIWLFGGIYRVLSRAPIDNAHSYSVEHVAGHDDLIGRLKIQFKRPSRGRAVRLESFHDQMFVSELLREVYSGEPFPGYENISHDFSALETIFRADRPDWKSALANVKGVYLIVDKANGRKYVGSAYGSSGIWSRWACYMGNGHGMNDELTALIEQEGMGYARRNFRMSLLEYRPAKTDDQVIIERENFWKEALLSRIPIGYNKN